MPTLYCPNCGYNLTGLSEHRCPECGGPFSRQHLEEEVSCAGELIRKIRIKMFLFPLLYAALIPCWFSIPTSASDHHSPMFWLVIIILISAVPVFVPPIWTGWTLGKQYARARRITAPAERVGHKERPEWLVPLLFAAGQTALMFLYFGVGVLVLVFLVNVIIFN